MIKLMAWHKARKLVYDPEKERAAWKSAGAQAGHVIGFTTMTASLEEAKEDAREMWQKQFLGCNKMIEIYDHDQNLVLRSDNFPEFKETPIVKRNI